MAVGEQHYYDFLDFRLDVANHRLLKNGGQLALTPKSLLVLEMLIENAGRTTKKEDIFARLWPDNFVEDANLTQHIHVLRKALGQKPDGQPFIETVPKQGYRFTLQPQEIAVGTAPAEPEESTAETAESEPTTSDRSVESIEPVEPHLPVHANNGRERVSDRRTGPDANDGENNEAPPPDARVGPPRRRFVGATLVAVLGLMFLSGAIFYFRAPAGRSAPGNINSIAVLPFKVIGTESDKQKLGLGMADALINQLSRLGPFDVRPTSAIFPYGDRPDVDSAAAGRQLGVDAVLEGSLQREGDRTKASVQLLNVADGRSLWAETFYETTADTFTAEDLLAKRIATMLSARLSQPEE